MCWALADAGVAFEKRNPITSLMTDVATGTLREDILNEKLMSAIVEIKVPVERVEEVVRLVWDVEKRVDTVVALGVGTRCDEQRRRQRGRAGARAARLLAPAREDERRPRPHHESGGGAIRFGDGKAMTNTLHRFGDAQSFRDDFIVFAIASRGKNDENSVPKLRRFLEIAMQFKPVNLGDSRHGGAYRPSRSMSPLAHWNRDNAARLSRRSSTASTRPHGRRGVRQSRSGRAVHEGGARSRPRPQHQHLDVRRRRHRVLQRRRHSRATARATRSGSKARPSTCPTATCSRCRRCAGTAWSASRSRRR